MKVLHLGKFFGAHKGGVESVVRDLCDTSIFGETSVLAFSKDRSFVDNYNNVDVHYCRVNYEFASAQFSIMYFLVGIRLITNCNIIHAHFPNPLATLLVIFSKIFFPQKKIVIHWHSDIVKQKYLYFFFRAFEFISLFFSDKIIVTSKQYLVGSIPLKRFHNKCCVVPIGITINKFKLREKGSKIFIFSLGRHIYYKGFEHLIEAMTHLPERFELLLGGTGPLTDRLINLTTIHGLENRIKFLGRIDDSVLLDTYYQSHIFCLPSTEKSEAFGVVQLEAFSTGMPVVSCEISGSGVSWVNKHRYSGIVVEPYSPTALANAILEITLNLNDYSERAYTRFIDNFTVDKMKQSILDIYMLLEDKR